MQSPSGPKVYWGGSTHMLARTPRAPDYARVSLQLNNAPPKGNSALVLSHVYICAVHVNECLILWTLSGISFHLGLSSFSLFLSLLLTERESVIGWEERKKRRRFNRSSKSSFRRRRKNLCGLLHALCTNLKEVGPTCCRATPALNRSANEASQWPPAVPLPRLGGGAGEASTTLCHVASAQTNPRRREGDSMTRTMPLLLTRICCYAQSHRTPWLGT